MTFRVDWRGAAVERRVTSESEKALRLAAEFVLEEANRTVPHEEGTLGRSGAVDADDSSATVSYDTKYARRQHEEIGWAHNEGRRAKWLELTLREQRAKIIRYLADRLGRAF